MLLRAAKDFGMVKRSGQWLGLVVAVIVPLAGCAGSGLEQSLAPDPQLQNGGSDPLQATASLPPDFPSDIPLYPGAALRSVTGDETNAGNIQVSTRWATRDDLDSVMSFYREAFRSNDWQLETDDPQRLVARQGDRTVQFAVIPAPAADTSEAAPEDATDAATGNEPSGDQAAGDEAAPESARVLEFTLTYGVMDRAMATDRPNPTPPEFGTHEPLTDSWANRPSPAPSGAAREESNGTPTVGRSPSATFSDLSDAPTELQPYILDLASLGIIQGTREGTFLPNETTTRRAYARWLFATNNALFSDQPAKQIRAAVASETPSFQDVPASDPDFEVIQGLANAGLIPSPLSGSSTTVRFRPDAPLTREDLILWKVPLDTRQPLPTATLEAVQQTWGFQDAGQIDPRAQRAVLADFQNGDRANIRRAFGFTTLFQPDKPVTRAEAVAVLWHFGTEGDGMTAREAIGGSE